MDTYNQNLDIITLPCEDGRRIFVRKLAIAAIMEDKDIYKSRILVNSSQIVITLSFEALRSKLKW